MRRNKLALLILFACLQPLWALDRPLEVEIDNFDGGVDTAHLADKLRLSNLADCLNFLSDRKYGLSRREGSKTEAGCLNTSTLNLWRYVGPSGTEYLIRLDCRGNLIAGSQIKFGDQCFSQCVATTSLISITEPTDATECLGKIWFTNKTNGLSSWDESNYVSYSNAPLASQIACHKNRVILGDISNFQSSIYLSGELNGGDYNTDSRFSTSPISIPVGGVNDGNKVFWIHAGLDELLVGKAFSLHSLLGNDQRDFRMRVVSPEIGSIYPRTVAQRAERTLFLSNRGLDSYTPPYAFDKVGEPIQDQLNTLSALTANRRSFTINTQGQWALGFSNPIGNISASFVPGAIGPINQQFIDTVQSDWEGGVLFSSYSSLSAASTPGSLVFIASIAVIVPNPSFETGAGFSTNPTNWTVFSASGAESGGTSDVFGANRLNLNTFVSLPAFAGNMTMTQSRQTVDGLVDDATDATVSSTTAIVLLDENDQILTSQNYTLPTAASWTKREFDSSAFAGRIGRIKIAMLQMAPGFGSGDAGLTVSSITSSIIYFGTSVVFYDRVDNVASLDADAAFNRSILSIDLVRIFPAQASFAQFISHTFDTQVSSPSYGPFQADVKFGTVTFGIQSASSTVCCWEDITSVSTQAPTITSTSNRYFRYVSTFNVSATSTNSVTIRIDSVTLGSYVAGYFQTPVQDVGTNITSWGLLTAEQSLNGGGITHQVQSSNDGTLNESNWVTQSLNSNISVPVRRFIASRIIFTAGAATHTPSVDALTYNWNEGEDPPSPLALTYKDSYYLFYSTSVTSGQDNDKIAVFNRNNAIDLYGGLHAGGAVVFNNTILIGDSQQTGNVMSLFTSTNGTDSGQNVNSYFKLRRLYGDKPDAVKIFDKIYMTASRDDASVSQIFNVQYSLDGSTTTFNASNVEISTGAKVAVLKSFIPINQPRQGYYIDIGFSEVTRRTLPYNINRIKLYGTIKEVQ